MEDQGEVLKDGGSGGGTEGQGVKEEALSDRGSGERH